MFRLSGTDRLRISKCSKSSVTAMPPRTPWRVSTAKHMYTRSSITVNRGSYPLRISSLRRSKHGSGSTSHRTPSSLKARPRFVPSNRGTPHSP